MATKKRRSDEGGSGAESKGRVPAVPDENPESDSPYGDTEIGAGDLDELEREGLMGSGTSRRREQIASNPDNEEELAEEALESSSEDEEEATHDRRRRG
jgi:hypothetical protein